MELVVWTAIAANYRSPGPTNCHEYGGLCLTRPNYATRPPGDERGRSNGLATDAADTVSCDASSHIYDAGHVARVGGECV